MSLVQLGKKMSEETKQKISDKLKGKKKSETHIISMSKAMILIYRDWEIQKDLEGKRH